VFGVGGSVWAVGAASGDILRYDGRSWDIEATPSLASFAGVFARSGDRVFVVGETGSVLSRRP
jgi:hypothetical protein